jgi:MtN3 and saliva related transmembrane protein
MLVQAIGFLAAALTSLSYIPQVRKAMPAGSTDDLSFKTLAILATGLALWIVYGVFRSDMVIVLANTVGLILVAILIGFKVRDTR